MASTYSTTEPALTTATIAVRIPRGADTDLASAGERRLSAIEGVREVTIEACGSIEPRLSATVVTVVISIERTVSATELRDRLAASTSIEAIERFGGA